jgi:hypothetical protein
LPVLLLCLGSGLPAQEPEWKSADHISTRISRATLDSITARGREIAAYDAAAWHATDAVLALHPAEGRVAGYLVRRRVDGLWEVVFGRPSAGCDTFYVAYRAVQSQLGSDAFAASVVEPADPETDSYALAARALAVAGKDFGPFSRPYNRVVFRLGSSDEWLVYFVPAPTRAGYWPLGADVRYRVGGDGREVREKRQLQNSLMEFGPPEKAGHQFKAGYHTALLDDRPEDTDVFYVLSRSPAVPEYVVSRSFYFRIDVDGQITAYDREGAGR